MWGDECVWKPKVTLGVFLNHSSPWVHGGRLSQLNPGLNDKASLACQLVLGIPCFSPSLHEDYSHTHLDDGNLKLVLMLA